MAEANTPVTPDEPEKADVTAQADNLTAPVTPDIGESGGAGLPPLGNSAPDVSDTPGEAASETVEKTADRDNTEPEAPADEAPAPAKGRGGRPPKTDRPDIEPTPDKPGKQKQAENIGGGASGSPAPATEEAQGGPSLAEQKRKMEQELREKYGIPRSGKAVEPWVAPEVEQVVRIPHEKLHSFKDHPFNVDKNAKYMAFVSSIRAHGVTQPAVVRPKGKDNFEIISGHRRDEGSKDAQIPYTPCIIRALNDDQAIQQMVEDNVNNREISTMELARALSMQLDSIKRQGARDAMRIEEVTDKTDENINKRSNEIIAERNGMSVTNVKRYISLNNLIPAMQEFAEGKVVDKNVKLKLDFTTAVLLSNLTPKNQEYLAMAIDSMQTTPSGAQAKRMRELEKEGVLNGDTISGIMTEEKREERQVIFNTQELGKYFGPEKSPKEMKDTILKLLDEYAEKNPLEKVAPTKSKEAEK